MKNIDVIKQETKSVIINVLPNMKSEDLSDSSNLFSMGLDSINAMTLVLKLQNSFDIKFAANDINAENFQSIATLVKLIHEKQG
ncbi:D-alanine--poly(phosphoribitol) ligase subunit 2 [Calothrix sp. NIES-4071]|nr:D-alanine--poly(phosphoribitol) ligase subunit 2 [Calothrix sp. NIES-4071]BAZ55701.1 D-alanine--poly(phosphoribitol) ligase subunit 2 [Calothrix sp. NIES-4105]